MQYRALGNTGLSISEIGLGAEWLERHNAAEIDAVLDECQAQGINILDCWMSEPNVRTNIGKALEGRRDAFMVQGHIGSTWQGGQYVRTRQMDRVKEAFDDLLCRLATDYIDFGMIHFVDSMEELDRIFSGPYLDYVQALKRDGVIRHIGLSSHNPLVAQAAAGSGVVELLLFSINPAFDLLPASEDFNQYFADDYAENLNGIAPERAKLYQLCQERGVGINVMKGYAGGRLFSAKASPFGVALTPLECLHYALTRPGVVSVLAGCETPEQVRQACAYESASDAEKDYAAVLAGAPKHAYGNGQCTYCGHCAPCPKGIDVAMVNKLSDLASMHDTVPASLRAHYEALGVNADDCIGCGQCQSRCPFHVPVVERMRQTKALFSR